MNYIIHGLLLGLFSLTALAGGDKSGEVCQGFGPQAPRDINLAAGENRSRFSFAPDYRAMNLCNIHFHTHAEHKAKAFSIYAGAGKKGLGGGYRCQLSQHLTKKERVKPSRDICNGVQPGDTVEVHWVHSSCQIAPGPGLGSCLSSQCANPALRVETQVFTVVNDSNALDFNQFAYGGKFNGYHQAGALPANSGTPVEYTGSTTGPKYDDRHCSSLQVSWSVRPQCVKLDINSLGKWCENNVFEEEEAHGVRKLVTDTRLLSKIN